MKTEIIFGIISGICLTLGCIFYMIHCKKENDKKFGIISVILTALGIGLFIGITNKPSDIQQENTSVIEEVVEDENESEIDP